MLVKKHLHVKSGDTVEVISGDEKGKRGRVLHTLPEKNKIVVEGVNYIWKHLRRSQQHPQGGRLQREAPIQVSKVMVVDAKTDKPTRVKSALRTEKRGDKTVTFRYRVGKKSGEPLTAKDREYAEKKS
jgi:large subunit ribosomal protein L24